MSLQTSKFIFVKFHKKWSGKQQHYIFYGIKHFILDLLIHHLTLESWYLLKERPKQIKDEKKQLDYHIKYFKKLLGHAGRAVFRSSRSQMFFKIGVLKSFANLHRKTPVLESLFKKVADLKVCNFIIKRLQYRCFPVKFVKYCFWLQKGDFNTDVFLWNLRNF